MIKNNKKKIADSVDKVIITSDITQREACVRALRKRNLIYQDVVNKNFYINKNHRVGIQERETIREFLEQNVFKESSKGDILAMPVNDGILDAAMIGAANEFNIIDERLEALPIWDNKDYIQELSNTVTLENENERELFTNILKKWLVASIGQMQCKSKNELVLILSGEQGNGKTKWFEQLFKIWSGLWISKNLNVENKDDKIILSENVFNLWDEMTSMKRNDNESLKALLSVQDYSERKPYRRDNEHLKRIISFCGCTNDPNILKDSTGSRRFHIFETTEIDYFHDVNIEQVFAQAKVLYDNKDFTYWLTQTEIAESNIRGRDFTGTSTIKELYFAAIEEVENEKDGKSNWMTPTQVATSINIALRREVMRLDNYTAINVGKLLTGLGCEKKRTGTGIKYLVR